MGTGKSEELSYKTVVKFQNQFKSTVHGVPCRYFRQSAGRYAKG